MKKSRIVIISVIITLVVVSAAAIVYKVKTGASSKPTIVRIEKAQRGELIEFVSAPGEIEPRINVEISAKVSARIIELPYEEGDIVTCGSTETNPPVPASVLLRLDAKDLESRLLSAEANYSAQEAQLEVENARISSQQSNLIGLEASLTQAQRDLERQKGLLESQDISQATYDQSKLKFDELNSQYESAKHTLDAAKLNLVVLQHNLEAAGANVTQAKEALSYTTITSPIDGVVTRINAEVGEVVIYGTMNNPGTVIMEVADLSTMLLVAQVDEADVGKLRVGQKATVYVQTFPDDEFKGVVDTIALTHRISPSTATKYFRTEILLEGDVKKLFSGLTAHVDIETIKHEDVLNVPSQAVLGRAIDDLPLKIRENNPEVDKEKTFTPVVYRYIDGKAVVTPVKIGPSNLTNTIIKSGITEEDNIVVGPYKVLEGIKHDQKIRDEREVEAEKKKKKKADGSEAGADANDASDANNVKEN
ncbi:MAG TPA: efflux RND transporter periplasmic adaptor subunit [Sedimentisphaerales bacterium]|nr:efflux RND transporter periplasmic adaptor subunit [Sedimentisphaerales bacterium]